MNWRSLACAREEGVIASSFGIATGRRGKRVVIGGKDKREVSSQIAVSLL